MQSQVFSNNDTVENFRQLKERKNEIRGGWLAHDAAINSRKIKYGVGFSRGQP